jgi:hypothetical protein
MGVEGLTKGNDRLGWGTGILCFGTPLGLPPTSPHGPILVSLAYKLKLKLAATKNKYSKIREPELV